ncbi:MAG: hypothetical protein LR017_03280 [Candidatus Pacebacteria bacterium]|nr:hypothetical protein [Candidatus Paceibacterota bacterium]
MKLLLAVVEDLYTFARTALFGVADSRYEAVRGEISDYELEEALAEHEQYLNETLEETETEVADVTETEAQSFRPADDEPSSRPADASAFRSTENILKPSTQSLGGEKNTLMYIGGADVPLFLRATREFDSVIGRLPYGAMVMVLEQRGSWTRVVHGTKNGWVKREDLMEKAAHVYPDCTAGTQNEALHQNTLRIRACIDDSFAGGVAELPLQSAEYVTYRLLRKGLIIPWPEVRPRTVGTWHNILKGVTTVAIGVTPKTGAVMEYTHTDDRGQVAYVEAVRPDETITITEVLDDGSGTYAERVLTREEWQQLSPIFIQVV